MEENLLLFCILCGVCSAGVAAAPDPVLEPPSAVEVEFNGRQLNATWKSVEEAVAYYVRIFKITTENESDGKLQWQSMVKHNELTAEIDGSFLYEVTVASCGGFNGDSCGMSISAMRRAPRLAPSSPLNLQLLERFKDRFTISWDAPLHLNGPLDGYYAEFIGDGEMQAYPVVIDGKASNYTFVDEVIKADTEYNVTLRAFNYPEGGTKDSPVDEWLLSDVVHVRIDKSAPSFIKATTEVKYLQNIVTMKWTADVPADSTFVVSTNCSDSESVYSTVEFKLDLPLVADVGDLCRVDISVEGLAHTPTTLFIAYNGLPRPKEIKAHIDDEMKLQAEIISPLEESPDVQLKYQCVLDDEDFPDTFLESNICVRDLKPYTEYTIRARICTSLDNCGLVLSHKVTTPVAAPSPVETLIIYKRLKNDVTIVWPRPLDLNGPLDGYLIKKDLRNSEIDEPWIRISNDTNFYSLAVDSRQTAEIRLCAYNLKEGAAADDIEGYLRSEETLVTVGAFNGPDDLVDRLTADFAEDGSLDISWSPKGVHGTDFKGFHVQLHDNHGYPVYDDVTENSQCTVQSNELRGDIEYNITVKGCSSVSPLECGEVAIIQKKTAMMEPSTPNIRLVKRYASQIIVSWSDPEILNGPLDGFIIQIYEVSAGDGEWKELNRDEHEHKFEVKESLEYEVQLKAFNLKKGQGDEYLGSPSAFLRIPEWKGSPPPAKIGFGFTDVVTLTWDLVDFSSCEPSDPTIYHVYTESFDANNKLTQTNRSSHSPIISLDSLAPYTEYRGRVRACCKEDYVQCGDWASANVTTDPTAPSEPQYLSAELHSDGFLIFWTYPDYVNGPLDGFLVAVTSSKEEPAKFITVDRKTTQYKFDYLKDGSLNYAFVKAFNYDRKSMNAKLMSQSAMHSVDPKNAPAGSTLWILFVCVLVVAACVGGGLLVARKRLSRKINAHISVPETRYTAGRDYTTFTSVDLSETTRL